MSRPSQPVRRLLLEKLVELPALAITTDIGGPTVPSQSVTSVTITAPHGYRIIAPGFTCQTPANIRVTSSYPMVGSLDVSGSSATDVNTQDTWVWDFEVFDNTDGQVLFHLLVEEMDVVTLQVPVIGIYAGN